jgi:MFS family permease
MKPRTLFIASCVALITSAFTFIIRGDILPLLGEDFNLSQEQLGWIAGGAFWGMAFSMLVGAPLCDVIGMKAILFLAFACHMAGVFGTIFAPDDSSAFAVLFTSTFLAGCGNGLVEIAINPLAATLFPDQKTHYLNILHAWWPGGLVIGGLIARAIGGGIDLGFVSMPGLEMGWKARMLLIVVPGVTYFLMCLPQKFPATERVSSGVTTGEMFGQVLRPMFLLWAFCMILTAATELGPQQWQESVMIRTTDGQVSGTLILVYTSMMMFVLRHFAGPLAHALSPVGMLTCSAILAAIGLRLLSTANSPATAFGYATIFGLGIAYFWPTMLGVTAERFPKGGAFLLGLMGSVGNLAIALVLPFMGYTFDEYAVSSVRENSPQLAEQVIQTGEASWALRLFGIEQAERVNTALLAEDPTPEVKQAISQAEATGAAMAFRTVSRLPLLLIVIFGAIAIYDKMRGGYKAEVLISRAEENELFAGGVQAPVE